MSLDLPSILIGLFFGMVGFMAWRHGRRVQSARHMLLGAALIGFGYVVPSPWWAAAIGLVLTGLLFWP